VLVPVVDAACRKAARDTCGLAGGRSVIVPDGWWIVRDGPLMVADGPAGVHSPPVDVERVKLSV